MKRFIKFFQNKLIGIGAILGALCLGFLLMQEGAGPSSFGIRDWIVHFVFWLFFSLIFSVALLGLAGRGARREGKSMSEGEEVDEHYRGQGLVPTDLTWRNAAIWLLKGMVPLPPW